MVDTMNSNYMNGQMNGTTMMDVAMASPEHELRWREERERKLQTLSAVWLYDEDEEARKLVDGDGKYGVYGSPYMRNDDSLDVFGRDYAEAAAPELAGSPLELCEKVIAGMPAEKRKGYQEAFNAIFASGNDSKTDWYALYGRMVRDEVRGRYEERQRVRKQQAERLETIVKDTLAGRGGLPGPEDYALLAGAGIKYDDLSLAGYVAESARHGASAEQQADILFERKASPAARQMALQQIAADALEAERKTGERGFFGNLAGSFSSVGEAVEDVAKSILPSGRNMLHPDMMRGSDGEWLNQEQLSGKVTNRAAWRARVREAVEQGRGLARDEIGFRVSSMPSNLVAGLVRLAPWLAPGIGQGPAMGGLVTDSLSQGYGVQQAARDEGDESIGDGQVLGKALAQTAAGSVPLFGGSWLVRNGVGRLLPRSMTWGARALGKAPVAYAANAAATTATFGALLPTVEYGLNAAYDKAAWYQSDKLDTGVRDLEQLGEQLGSGAYWAEQGLLGAALGAPAAGATRMRARQYLGDLKGALSMGITRKQFEGTVHLKPEEQIRELERIRLRNMEEDAEGTIKRAVAESQEVVDREKAIQWRTDESIKAAMEELGLSVEDAGEEGKAFLRYGGEVLPDGSFKRGEKKVVLSREDADAYLQACIGSKLEGMADVLRHAAGNRRLLDAFRETLKGEVRVEWMREADNLAKAEGWAERAKERIETRTAELAAGGMGAKEARAAAEKEVHKDITDRGTLGELVRFAANMRERYEQETARSGREIDPRAFGSRANVTRQASAGGSRLRRVLRIAMDARVDEVAEELGEQVMYDWREREGMSVTEAYRYLRRFADWAAGSGNAAVAEAAGRLLSLDKTHPELAERVMAEGFNEYDLGADELRAVERELTEAGSTLMLSGLRQAAADGQLPPWARGLFEAADLNLLDLERDMNLAMAMEQARQEGVLPEAAQKLFGAGREAVEAALREEPKAQEYHTAWMDAQKRQDELDAAYGAGRLTEPSITEAFEARAREGQEALERAREEEEARAAATADERLEEFAAEPENEGRPHEELVREAAERAADAGEERLQGEPGAVGDDAFAGGLCLEISDEGGLVCKSGLLEVGKLNVLPNFKLGADAESGVVQPLKGDYRPDHDPIRVWRKADGELLVISGRHRLDAAKRAGATRIAAYVYDESGVRDLAWARRYDIESNIRDNQATPLEVALYVRGEFSGGVPLTNEEAERAGITREGKLGSIGYRIGRRAGESVMDALRNGRIDDRVALWIADFCPGNDAVQRRGLEAALRDASKAEVLARMEAELAKLQMQDEMGLGSGFDLFGNALDNDEFMDFVARFVVRRRNELAQDASYLNATAKKKNAEAMGKKYGVDVKDPVALKKKLDEVNALRERWKNPYSDSELMDEIRAAWRGREGDDVPAGAMASRVETPSEKLFREYAAGAWRTEGVDFSFTDDDGELRNLSRAYATDAQGNRLGEDAYITTPLGNLDWYKFPQDEKTQKLLSSHNVKNLPIRLKVGKQTTQPHRGFGFMHILNHYDDFMSIGESPLLHLYNTLSNLVKIRGGYGGRYQFKGEYEGGRDSLLVAQLLEDDGCYSMVSCYPTQMNRKPQRGELVIGRVLFQFIPSSEGSQIQVSKSQDKATASSVSTSGQVSGGKIPQKAGSVNIYDVRVKDSFGEIFRQQNEPTVHFSICGLKAKTANEYLEKGADYRDPADGQRKFVLPTAGARLRSDVTPGMMNVPAGGHKDVSLAALLHYPELFRAYPQLAGMRVRLYRPTEETAVGGYFSPEEESRQAAYIAVNVAYRSDVLNTLLHESQHAIQQYEGFALGAGGFDQAGALAYVGKAIGQRKEAGTKDDWSRDNLAFLERLHRDIGKGDEQAIAMAYAMSHGEQEARYAGEMRGKAGMNPMDDASEESLTEGVPGSYTVAVRGNATDLGGVTFLNMGRFGYLLDERLMPAGEFRYDRRVYQMRENVMRRMRELRAQTEGSKDADGLRLAAEGLAVMDGVEALLPNSYRSALEPYKTYFNAYAKLRGSGDAVAAAATVPMRGWDARMYGSFKGLAYRLVSGKEGAHGEFWEHALLDVPGAEEGLAAMREHWSDQHELVEQEYAERMAAAKGAKEKAKARSLIEAETFERMETLFRDEMRELLQAIGSMRADKLMAKFLERVALQLDAYRKDTTLGRIRRVVDGLTPLPGKDGKPVKGRMAAEAYDKTMDLMRLLELTKGQKDEFERTRYTGEAGCRDGKLAWADMEPDAQVSVDTYDADGKRVKVACTKQEYEAYACFDGMTAAQAESAAKALGEFITTGRQAWDNMEELRRQRVAKMCAPLMEAYAETPNEKSRRMDKEQRGELPVKGFSRVVHAMFGSWMNDAQFFDAMTGVKEVEGFARDFTDRIARAHVYLEVKEKERRKAMMDAVFEASCAKTGKEAREFIDFINKTEQTGIVLREQEPDFLAQETATLRAQFLGMLRRKTHKKNFSPNTFAAMMKHLEAQGEGVVPRAILDEAMAKYGAIGEADKSVLHGADAMASVMTVQELARFGNLTQAAKKRAETARGKWLEEREKKGGEKRSADGGGLELTRSKAAYRVLLCEQEDYKEMLRLQGYTDEVVEQLRAFAGEKMMRMAYRLRELLGERTPQIKETYERVYGMPFPEVENYFRAYFNTGYEAHSEAIMGGAGEGRAAGKGTAKILYTRRRHNEEIDPTMNVLAAFECAMKEQDIMLGYGDLPSEVAQVLNFRDGALKMSDALAKVFSSHTVGEMKKIAEDMTRAMPTVEDTARWMTRCLSAMGGSTAEAILNYRVGTLFKQGTALFNTLAGSDRVGWREWHKAAGRVNVGLGKISLREMAARPELDGRFKGWAASVDAEAMLGEADVVSAKGATDAAARAGMSLMEWIDMRANVRACATLYDAVYRKTQKENPGLTHEELDADAMNEVQRALAFKSQPLDWRSRALLGSKRSLFSIGNLFLGGESMNTMGNIVRLMARGKNGDLLKAAYVWLEHGIALQLLTAVYNWMTDDEEQWKRRSWQQYVAGSVLGPLAGLPVVSALVGAGTGVLNQFLPKGARVWMPSQSLLPMADMERVAADLRKVFWGKKPSSWQDKTIAVENFLRTVATFGILASRNPTSAGGARVKAVSYGVAAVTNILDFLLRAERAVEERLLD